MGASVAAPDEGWGETTGPGVSVGAAGCATLEGAADGGAGVPAPATEDVELPCALDAARSA